MICSFPLERIGFWFLLYSLPTPTYPLVIYGEYAGVINIRNGKMLEGDLPSKALAMIEEWTLLHQQALLEMWETQKFSQLPPLE